MDINVLMDLAKKGTAVGNFSLQMHMGIVLCNWEILKYQSSISLLGNTDASTVRLNSKVSWNYSAVVKKSYICMLISWWSL